jgi:hypothetical protein
VTRSAAFVVSVSLAAVNMVGLGGERRAARESSLTRFDVTGHLTDETGTDFGHVSASVLVMLTTSAPVADVACIERFDSTRRR